MQKQRIEKGKGYPFPRAPTTNETEQNKQLSTSLSEAEPKGRLFILKDSQK